MHSPTSPLKIATTRLANRSASSRLVIVQGPKLHRLPVARRLASQEPFRIDQLRIVNSYIGETEKNLNLIFANAARQSSILFFDEADALFGKRSEVADAHDRYANQEISYLLNSSVSVILGVASASSLDPAVLRVAPFILEAVQHWPPRPGSPKTY